MSGKGVDPVKLATLEAILTQYQGDIMALVKAWDDERHLVYAGDEEVIYRFSEALSDALAQLPPEAIDPCVEAWAATEEWRLDGADTPEGRESLRQWLSAVARLPGAASAKDAPCAYGGVSDASGARAFQASLAA